MACFFVYDAGQVYDPRIGKVIGKVGEGRDLKTGGLTEKPAHLRCVDAFRFDHDEAIGVIQIAPR